jgi:hypothetical protein
LERLIMALRAVDLGKRLPTLLAGHVSGIIHASYQSLTLPPAGRALEV